MKFTGFASGCVGKALTVVLCIILGMVLALGGIALTGYLILTKDGMMGTVSDQAKKAGVELDFDDDVKAMSVLAWGQEVMAAVGDMSKNTIGSLEKLIGMSIISDTIEDVIGVQASVVKESTLDGLGKTVSNNLTITNAKEKFGIEFPDMPIFSDSDFLASPLASAFGEFDNYALGDVINIDGDSNSVLLELKDVAIKDIGSSSTDSTIKSMLLCQLMTIDDSANMTLKALKYSSIESQYERNEDGSIKEDEEGNKIYKTKTITEIQDGTEVEKTVPLKGINDTIDELYVKDVVEITEDGAVVLRKMRTPTEEETAAGKAHLFGTEDLLVKDLGGEKVTAIIDSTTIGELIEIHEADDPDAGVTKSEPILIALKDVTVDGLNDKMQTLRLDEIFEADSLADGALSLIPPETVLSGIPSAVTAAMTNSTTATLAGKSLISADSLSNIGSMPVEQQAFIYNSDLGAMLSGIIDFIADPISTEGTVPSINYYHIAPEQKTISDAAFSSITAFVAAYAQYDSLTFSNSTVSVTVSETDDAAFYDESASCYVVPMFNVKSTGTTISVTGGTVKLASFDVDEAGSYYLTDGKYALNRNQYGFAYAGGSSTLLDAAYDTLITYRYTTNY